MRVLRDAGAEIPKDMDRFPSTIKKRGLSIPPTHTALRPRLQVTPPDA